MSRQTAKRVLRAVQAGQVGPLDNPGFADGDDHRLPRLRSTHLQAEEAERTGAVDLPVEVATPLLGWTEHPVLAAPGDCGALGVAVAGRGRLTPQDEPATHPAPVDRHPDRVLVVADKHRSGRETEPTKGTTDEGAPAVGLTVGVAFNGPSDRRRPRQALHALHPSPSRHRGPTESSALDITMRTRRCMATGSTILPECRVVDLSMDGPGCHERGRRRRRSPTL